MLFDNQLTCSYSDLVEVAQAYRDYVTENYKYNSGSRLITSYENAYLIFMEFANKPECVDSTIIACELIEPGNLDFSDRQVRTIDYVMERLRNGSITQWIDYVMDRLRSGSIT